MPGSRKKKGRSSAAKRVQPDEGENQNDGHAAIIATLRLLTPCADDATALQQELAAEYVLEALDGGGLVIGPSSCEALAGRKLSELDVECVELEELLADALASVGLEGASKPQRAAAVAALLDKSVLRIPARGQAGEQARLRLEAVVHAEEAAAAAELFSLREGLDGLARLPFDESWHPCAITAVLGGDADHRRLCVGACICILHSVQTDGICHRMTCAS